MFIRSRNTRSILKHSGALISSKLIPPKVGSREATASMNLSGSFWSISISKTSIPANFLNRTPLPSITGFDANGPILPRPSTAVPLVMTPTKLLRAVYLEASFGSF